MTHSEIYPKFMIEYDKANVTSSYPSLTKYEIATILDKAYLALIAQKFTGNNYRQVAFEHDIKNLEDLRPLIMLQALIENTTAMKMSSNDAVFDIPVESLYYVKSDFVTTQLPTIDDAAHIITPVMLITHEDAALFINSTYNMPWIKNPVAVMLDNHIHILYDSYENKGLTSPLLNLTYIKYPTKFVISETESTTFDDAPNTEFELSDSMAEELINLAIVMAAEEVEAQRQTTKLNQRALES